VAEPGVERVEPTLEYWLARQASVRRRIEALDAEPTSASDDVERMERRRRLTWDSWNMSNRISALRNRERQQRGRQENKPKPDLSEHSVNVSRFDYARERALRVSSVESGQGGPVVAVNQAIHAQEDLDRVEADWRDRLTGRSLVIEADAPPALANEVLKVLGFNYQRDPRAREQTKLLGKYRASLLVGVCASAFKYDVGGMWPYLEDAFGELGAGDQQLISEAFRNALDHFGLSRFAFPRRNVDEILMHVGIPGQRMDEFISLLAKRDARGPGLDGRQFCGWVGSLSQHTAFAKHGLDAPTYRFLGQGREIAEDLVDRCLDLLDIWARDPKIVDVSGFPLLMQHDLLRALDELGETNLDSKTRSRERHLDLNPAVLFSPTRGVEVRLPPLELVADGRVNWLVAYEGATQRRSVEPPWPGDPVRSEFVSVSRPVKEVSLTAEPGDHEWAVSVVDPDDPLLVFDTQTGALIPPRNSLPRSDVWIAVPNSESKLLAELVEFGGASPAAHAEDAPLGWGMWTFASVSLVDVTRLRSFGVDRWRVVSTVARPTIELVGGSPWMRGVGDGPVCASIPRITIPAVAGATGGEASVKWTISVTDVATGEVVAHDLVTARDTPVEWSAPEGVLSSALGTFDFAVKGPLGRGVSKRVNLAVGVGVTPDREFRPMSPGGDGLIPLRFDIALPPTVNGPQQMSLGPRDDRTAITLSAPGGHLEVLVSVPCMEVMLIVNEKVIASSHSPVSVDLEDLVSAQLRVTFGGPGHEQLVALHGDAPLQTVRAQATGSSGTATFNLAQLSDTISHSLGAVLVVGSEGLRIPVARVRPRLLANSMSVEAGLLTINGLATDQPLELAVYPRYAPWLAPTVLATESQSVALPESLLGESQARVLLRIADPWVVQSWPASYPSRTVNIFDVELGELDDSNHGDEAHGFRSWLKRSRPCPSMANDLPLAIGLYASTSLDKYRTPGADLRRELALQVQPQRHRVPAEYSRVVAAAAPIGLFVEAGVVTLPPGPYECSDSLWESSPLLAALAQDWSDPDALSGRALRTLGDTIVEIIGRGTDPFAATGRFDSTSELISRWPEERIEMVWKSVNAIPGRLLDVDTRMIAAKQLFDRRRSLPFDVRSVAQALSTIENFLSREFGDAAAAVVTARRGLTGWTTLPQITITLALLARAAARGSERAQALYEHHKSTHASLAQIAPLMVEQDLILAELWMTRWRTL
jgi:hypothetical protein